MLLVGLMQGIEGLGSHLTVGHSSVSVVDVCTSGLVDDDEVSMSVRKRVVQGRVGQGQDTVTLISIWSLSTVMSKSLPSTPGKSGARGIRGGGGG